MNEQTPLFKESRPTSAQDLASTPDTKANASDAGALLTAVNTLQYQFNTLLILMLIVSGTLAVFFYVQCRHSGQEVRNLRDNALPQIHQYNTNTVPQMQRFIENLKAYAQSHPEVVPLLQRYGIDPRPAGAPSPPPAQRP